MDKIVNVRNMKNKKVILYGSGYIGHLCNFLLKKLGIYVYEVTDSNLELWNTEFEKNLLIKSNVDVLFELSKKKQEYIIITSFLKEELFRESLSRNDITALSYKDVIDIYVQEITEETYYVDYEKQLVKWFMSLSEELSFWENTYAKAGARKNDLYLSLAESITFCEKYLTCSIKENNVVMDIGSGILSRYGSRLDNEKSITLIPIDPLAYWYNLFNKKYLDKKQIVAKEKIVFGLFEGLSYSFLPNTADLIIISNALDHCIDPIRSILECLKVLKEGGTLLLKHLRREAINEKEIGLHQWNIDCLGKELVIWNRDSFINVSKLLNECTDIKISVYDMDERGFTGNFGFIVAEIKKTKEINKNVLEKYDKKDVSMLVKKIQNVFWNIVEKDYTNQSMWEDAFKLIDRNE